MFNFCLTFLVINGHLCVGDTEEKKVTPTIIKQKMKKKTNQKKVTLLKTMKKTFFGLKQN